MSRRQGPRAAGLVILLLLLTSCVRNRPLIRSLPVTLHLQETSLDLVGSRRDGELMPAPILDDRQLKLAKSERVPVGTVFSALVPRNGPPT